MVFLSFPLKYIILDGWNILQHNLGFNLMKKLYLCWNKTYKLQVLYKLAASSHKRFLCITFLQFWKKIYTRSCNLNITLQCFHPERKYFTRWYKLLENKRKLCYFSSRKSFLLLSYYFHLLCRKLYFFISYRFFYLGVYREKDWSNWTRCITKQMFLVFELISIYGYVQ